MRDLKYFIAYIAPLSAFWAVFAGGVWSFTTVVVAFVLIPLLDQLFAQQIDARDANEESSRSGQILFDWLLYANVPILYGLLVMYGYTLANEQLTSWEIVGMTLSVGIIVGTTGINVAHELGHRNKPFEVFLAKVLLLPALYQHFFIEHNLGHHKFVATEKDPATARLNETVFHFWLRSAWGSYCNAWKIEEARLKALALSPYSLKNQMVWFSLFNVAYLTVLTFSFGAAVSCGFIVAAIIGFLLLESVNYIEHYGIRRKSLGNGKYEPVQPHHSWNSNHEIGRIFLYELTRHADHHYKSTRKYQILRHFDASPQLPVGYPASILLSLVPPLWFRIMNKRLPKVSQDGLAVVS